MSGPQVNGAQNIEVYVLGLPPGTGTLNIDQGALGISPAAAPGQWFTAQSGKVDDMQQVERVVAQNIVARARSLRGAPNKPP